MQKLFEQVEDARALAQIIVDTVREPVLVLDEDFRILFASASFRTAFQLDPSDVTDRQLFALDGGAWDILALRGLHDAVGRRQDIGAPIEIAHDFPRIGHRVLQMHARTVAHKPNARPAVILNIEDITERRAVEIEKEQLKLQADELVLHKEMLLEEMQHRIVNSLQIIASILMLKARAVNSEETRQHLQDAHRRVISVAAVQRHLHSTGRDEMIEIKPYLTKLCASLAESMIGEDQAATLTVLADAGQFASADAVSLGLIVTELVINALKYAFPSQPADAAVTVRYEVSGADWKLTVGDNGVGRRDGATPAKGGLGTSLVSALANQLNAKVETESSPQGMVVTVTHTTFVSRFAPVA
ncbi:MAG: histidine kinase dimerization/phosphoacceptor domain -containing protein [Rhizomicrobium sp.]